MPVTTILPINSLHASDNYGIGSSRDMGYGNVHRTFSTFGTAEKTPMVLQKRTPMVVQKRTHLVSECP